MTTITVTEAEIATAAARALEAHGASPVSKPPPWPAVSPRRKLTDCARTD